MSHISLTYHLIFSTHQRLPSIPIAHEREMYKFLFDFSTQRGVKIWRIGGMPDHIHILCDIPPKLSVADYVKLVKAETSKFMRTNPHFLIGTDGRRDTVRFRWIQKAVKTG